jgi:hypothetical protein
LGFDLGWNKGETYEPMVDLGTWKRSSNGHWIMVASRRDDGNFCRVYFCHVDAKGHVTMAFMLPQRNPRHFYRDRFLSFNVPEFIIAPTHFDRR